MSFCLYDEQSVTDLLFYYHNLSAIFMTNNIYFIYYIFMPFCLYDEQNVAENYILVVFSI